ncbi:MAG: hypothetical protein US53_C0002G0005 [Candidatus Woesebacteria bacterium GW2011_GWA1_37_7]|uniref:Glycosyltransferase RgtA/B/C/D-like domain-containing protein n=1 Tax=Candidatus Woesebacteria bacterium GW2011_GWA1_37_7 TaxID=1618545 RepID=A0A0G0HHP5_9BACT|nr:MAG: hypothetical protein US53_C0002G0005 [Candidatus Woesebacteria bacterium GW2011_GWA1_37_7]
MQELIIKLLGKQRNIVFLIIAAFVFRLAFSFIVWHPDVNNHLDWGIRYFEYGPEKFYAPESNIWSYTWPNQPPGTIYIFAFSRKLFESIFNFFWFINIKIPAFPSGIITYFEHNLYPAVVKLPGIIADFGIAYLLYKYLRILLKGNRAKIVSRLGLVVFLYNPVIWYTSSVWGQYDSIINFFALLSFYLLIKKRLTFSLIALALCLFIKLSLVIFLPIYLVYLLKQKYSFFNLLRSILISFMLIGIFTLPFSHGEPYSWLYKLYIDKVYVQQQHLITANAFNIWATIATIHLRSYTQYLGPLMYKTWGFILFSLAYFPALYLLYKKSSHNSLIWTLTIAAFSSFMLLPNMHERYLYPLFPVLTILTIKHVKLIWVYISVSLISLLNLYNFWWVPKLAILVSFLAYQDRLTPRLLGFVNFIIFIYFYRLYLRQMIRAKL